MINRKTLLADLKAQVKELQQDLRPTALADEGLRREWQQARDAGRTAAAFEDPWLTDRVTQVAVAWVLATTFVRFTEDNGLLEHPFITGPDPDRAAQARELQERHFQQPGHEGETDRDWLRQAFKTMSVSPAARGLFEEHNPMWSVKPTHEAARDLIAFWRRTDASGDLVHDFTDPEWDTRFLGDLYQDLSDDAKKTYALLQTPEFVEEFILKYTLDPAIEEFGLEPEPPYGHADLPPGLRVIDPACGSGHFLLGAFRRILAAWEAQSPMTDKWTLINRSLQSVHGVDKNPYAAAIARFRLMLAAMREGDVKRLDEGTDFHLSIAVGDALLHGQGAPGTQSAMGFLYTTEDVDEYLKAPTRILASGTYHVVVGNPPYITPKDKADNENYRAYKSCSGKYALSVPFAERMFQLAIRGAYDGAGAGYVGQITANSFMKREFGKKLIEEYFPNIDLTYVVDASGAYIPGHGTPTVILFGRRRYSRSTSTVRAVLGIQGEPSEPLVPADGHVWQAIEHQIDSPGSESEWISVVDLSHGHFAKHPWSLSGGGADEVTALINGSAVAELGAVADSLGITAFTLEDDLYLLPLRAAHRHRISDQWLRLMVVGDGLRDWSEGDFDSALFPYDASFNPIDVSGDLLKLMWPCRTNLTNNLLFGGKTKVEDGLKWTEYGRLTSSKLRTPLSIAFAFVATHNHFVLDRGGKVFKQSAPIVKLSESATVDDHLSLLALLNSSTACFWLKQVSHDKGNRGGQRSTARYAWERFFEFTSTNLERLPLPSVLPLEFGRELDALARQHAAADSRETYDSTRARMISLQEELDWSVYHLYGLLSDDEFAQLVAPPTSVPELKLGERAFEFLLAERLDGEQGERQWFERHHSDPIAVIPKHWPDEYKAVVARRIEFIRNNRNIGLIERPEYKRRWDYDPWDAKEQARLSTWLLDRCEDRDWWFDEYGQPRPLTVSNLADRLRKDPEAVAAARQLAGADADMFKVINDLIDPEHVPYLAQLRYKAEGLVKRAVWEQTWNRQREEDRTGKRLDIPVPPRYTNADFHRPSFWRKRGKLDVPKERFISYPGASPASDDSLLLGWAGWDRREQAHVLVALIEGRTSKDGWGKENLTPLIIGLAEIMPWVRQWHSDPTDTGESWAEAYDGYLATQRERYGITDDDLTSWKPAQGTTRRRAKAKE